MVENHNDEVAQDWHFELNLNELKPHTLAAARTASHPVKDSGMEIGRLVPVGPWILESGDLIRQMAEWRARAMRMFLSQFESTPARTKDYLRRLSLAEWDRILFMIEVDTTFVGHIGLAHVANGTGELDNLMRGLPGGATNLLEICERTLLTWAFSHLNLDDVYLRVLSFNFPAKEIHEAIGFRVTERHPLRRVLDEDMTTRLVECLEEEAQVSYRCEVMWLSRECFAFPSDERGHE